MHWRVFLIIVGILSVQFILTLSCSAAHSTKQNKPDSLTITEKDENSKVKIELGRILTLKLEAIPGTGYAWHVVQNNPDLLKSLGKSMFEPIDDDTKKEMLGSKERQVFRFRAQSRGSNILELHYIRQWEKKVKPLKKFSITVLIH